MNVPDHNPDDDDVVDDDDDSSSTRLGTKANACIYIYSGEKRKEDFGWLRVFLDDREKTESVKTDGLNCTLPET